MAEGLRGKRVRRPKLPVSDTLGAELVITRSSVDGRRRERAQNSSENPIVEFWQAEVIRQRWARRAASTPKGSPWATSWLAQNHGGYWSAQPNIDIDPKLRKEAEKRLARLFPLGALESAVAGCRAQDHKEP